MQPVGQEYAGSRYLVGDVTDLGKGSVNLDLAIQTLAHLPFLDGERRRQVQLRQICELKKQEIRS